MTDVLKDAPSDVDTGSALPEAESSRLRSLAHTTANRLHNPLSAGAYRPFVRRVRRPARTSTIAMAGSAASEAMALAVLGFAATRHYSSAGAAVLISLAIAGTLLLSAVTKALADNRLAIGQIRLETQLRAEVTDAILHSDWQDFVDQPGHELQSAAISEAPQVAQATLTFVRGRASILAAVIVFATTFLVSPSAAAVCTVFGAVIVLLYNRSTRGLRVAQQQMAEGNVEITRQTSILISGLRSLRLSPIQRRWRADLQASFDRLAEARTQDFLLPVRARLVVEILAAVMILTVLLAQVALSGKLLPGLIVMALILRILPRVQTAQQLLAFAHHGEVWVERWNQRIQSLHLMTVPGSATNSGSHASAQEHAQPALEVHDVVFAYHDHSIPVLRSAAFTLHRGEWVSLRGVSGGGKSTLIDVIGGILRPTTGFVAVAGRRTHDHDLSSLYSDLAIVPQDVHLIGNTIDEIITWGGRLTPRTPIAEITRRLGVDEMFFFSEEQGGGVLDEMSRDISGGMRTRLAVARALVTQPSVLILDETTSRLHPQAEAEIFGAIRDLRPDLAVLVVTHREETTALVDRQLQLVDGRIEQL